MEVRTLNGLHKFRNQRYIDTTGISTYYLEEYAGKGLRELIAYYSNRLSYNDLSGLLKRILGKSPYSVRHLQHKVVAESGLISSYLQSVQSPLQLSLNFVEQVDIYASQTEELVYLDDGVGVKRQKETRGEEKALASEKLATVQTDVIVIGNLSNGYQYLSSAEANFSNISLEDLIHLKLSKNYADKPLPLVAITDGAQSIRCRLRRLFGMYVVVLLDWYHLAKKIRQYASRLNLNKAEKEKHTEKMLAYLWLGQTQEALIYSDKMIKTSQNKTLEDLQNYLFKHQQEICNYAKRQTLGKTIGSGRGEKANDQLVANRQKKKAMSWSVKGSNALAILKTLEVNQQWAKYWAMAA